MLQIGRIAYANCTPIFSSLVAASPVGRYRFVSGVPARLNGLLATGEIDVCPSSSFEYACRPNHYLILPGLSISSDGPVASVLLFSRVPIEELDSSLVLLSSESATSVNLLKILLSKRFGISCRYAQHAGGLDDALSDAPALLLIGDTALRESLRNHSYWVYDLGSMWREWTGLPFVFALWLCRCEAAEKSGEEVRRLVTDFSAAKAAARQNLQIIAERSHDADWMGVERLVSYWQENISYDLDTRHCESLSLFFRYCTELGLLPSEPPLRFFGTEGGSLT